MRDIAKRGDFKMKTKHNLESIVKSIKEASNGIVEKKKKFEDSADEYFISNVTESMLLDLGFEFKGYTMYGAAPYYEKDNIMAYFDDVVLHVMEMTYGI